MRYGPDHKRRTHERILDAAGRLFRRRGFAAAGVDGVMGEAGLTAGGFYAHFASKEALLEETLAREVQRTRTMLVGGLEGRDPIAWLGEVVRRYLSRGHRDAKDGGCLMPALVSELPRAGEKAREAFEAHLLELVRELGANVPAGPGLAPADRALATIALCVGGLTLGRAVANPALSDRILAACKKLAVPEGASR